LEETVGTIQNLLSLLGVPLNIQRINEVDDKYSFTKLTGREPGFELKNNFLTKGIIGDWLEKFSPEVRLFFYKYAGKALITSAYEIDDNWVY
jgi:hypothetical protein